MIKQLNQNSINEKQMIYSHSRLSTFEQCPYKFKLKYIDNIESEIPQTVEAFLGSRVHETLESIEAHEKIPEHLKNIKL